MAQIYRAERLLVCAVTIESVTADRVHLVRHGEVFNPDGVLYERLPGFSLSDRGRDMARSALDAVQRESVTALVVSPLQRAKESMEPWEKATGLTAVEDERVIEPWNEFRGINLRGGLALVSRPGLWKFLTAPSRPSWGEPFVDIADRMLEAMWAAAESVDGGDVVIVSHQLPIWMAHLALKDNRLSHNPTKRRCSLSSVTTFTVSPAGLTESGYWEPRGVVAAIDGGAV
jgi:broad specificity phosphatase PhoE